MAAIVAQRLRITAVRRISRATLGEAVAQLLQRLRIDAVGVAAVPADRRTASSSSGRRTPTRRAPPGPTMPKSRSTKFISSLAPKYSSPRLRPPTIAKRLSAIQVLLCMRRLMRLKLRAPSLTRLSVPLRDANGLKTRTSMLGCADSAAKCSLLARASMSSTSRRTCTPRSADSSSCAGEELAGEIGVPDVGLHVDAALGHARALHARDEGFGALDQQPESPTVPDGWLPRPRTCGRGASCSRSALQVPWADRRAVAVARRHPRLQRVTAGASTRAIASRIIADAEARGARCFTLEPDCTCVTR